MKVNSILIEKLNNEGALSHLAMFIHIKGLYSNSCIYNYSQDRMAAKLKISKSSIRKYINFYLKEGWATIKHGNLCLGKIRKIGKQRKVIWHEVTGETVKEIKQNLYLFLFKHKVEQTKWYIKTCHDLKQLNESGYRRKIRSLTKRYPNFSERIEKKFGASGLKADFKVSIVKIAEWFECSVGKAHQVIMKLIKDSKLLVVYGGYDFRKKLKFEREIGDKAFVSKGGYVIRVKCNRYMFAFN